MMSAKRASDEPTKSFPGRAEDHGRGRTVAREGEDREHISATERWLKISRRVYNRAQQRGFVGGDPLADLSEVAQEIDEEYVTDVPGLLALTDPAEMMDQLRSLFAGYGLSRKNLDRLLEMNRESIEKLARLNRSPEQSEARHAAQRKSLLKKTTNQAIKTLRGFNRELEDRTRNIPVLGESTRTVQSILSSLTKLASSAGDLVQPAGSAGRKRARAEHKRELELHKMVVKAYDGLTPAELADAPIAALRGVSEANGRKLRSAFGIRSISDMATSKLFERADGVVTLADAEQERPARGQEVEPTPLQKLADGPVHRLEGVTPHQAKVLQHTLKIDTVRDLSRNRFFRLARAIVSLAEAERRNN